MKVISILLAGRVEVDEAAIGFGEVGRASCINGGDDSLTRTGGNDHQVLGGKLALITQKTVRRSRGEEPRGQQLSLVGRMKVRKSISGRCFG